jgi:hypothetical protein
MFIPESPKPIAKQTPLDALSPKLSAQQLKTLRAHWIDSVQEFLALATLGSVQGKLARLLQLDRGQLEDLITLARRKSTHMRDGSDADDERLMSIDYLAGALLPAPGLREEQEYEKIPQEEDPPTALSYSDDLPPLRDQGARGSCVAHAAAAVREFIEIQHHKRSNPDFDAADVNFSEQFIYWWCKTKDGLPTLGGTYPYLGMQCLVDAGVPLEQTWRYNPRPNGRSEGQGPPPKKAEEEAATYRFQRLIHLSPDDIDSMKGALLQGKSVMITIPMFDSWYRNRSTRKFGKINMPMPNEREVGAHAMALVGYVDDDKAPGGGYFILRNAWRPWGLKNPLGPGLGTIPYAFLKAHNIIADSGELPVTADIYLRDNDKDRGVVPSRGLDFNSPDIWVRLKKDGKTGHQRPKNGQKSWIYVRARNLGPQVATQVQAEVLVAPASPSIWPDMWQPVGRLTWDEIDVNESAVAALSWTPKSAAPQRFLVRLSSPQDPPMHRWAVRYDNNIAQKNLIQLTMRRGQRKTLRFPLFGLPNELTLRHIRVDRRGFSGGRIGLHISRGQTWRNAAVKTEDEVLRMFAGKATERRMATLTIHINKNAPKHGGGRIIISQKYSKVLVGRLLIEVKLRG